MFKKILIILFILIIICIGIFGYYYYQNNSNEGNLQYVQVESGERILMPKDWVFTTGDDAGKALNIKNYKKIKPIFFASEQKNNSQSFYYIIKEELNGTLSKENISKMLKDTVSAERKNGYNVNIIDKGIINNETKGNLEGQFIIYEVNNIYKFIAYFHNRNKELITFTSYLHENSYNRNISLIKYIALKNKY